MLQYLIFSFFIFLQLIYIFIILDIIASWIYLIWLNLRPLWFKNLMDWLYSFIKKFIPTTIWPFEFAPMIIIFIIIFIQTLLQYIEPWIRQLYINLINNLI